MYVVPIVYLLAFVLAVPILTWKIVKEVRHFTNMLQAVDEEAKQDAARPILRSIVSDDMKMAPATVVESNSFIIGNTFFIVLLHIVTDIMIVLLLWRADSAANDLRQCRSWQYNSSSRIGRCYEVTAYVFSAVFATVEPDVFMTSDELKEQARYVNELLERDSNALKSSVDGERDITGYDEELDELQFGDPSCQSNPNPTQLHDAYDCFGLVQLFVSFKTLSESILGSLSMSSGLIDTEENANMLHMVLSHLIPRLLETETRISELEMELVSHYQGEMIGILCAGFCIALLAFGMMKSFLAQLDVAYGVAIALLKRLSPAAVVSDSRLMHYVLGKEKASITATGMGPTQSIVFSSSDGILLTSAAGMIDSVNPAVTHILGYSPEQVLGQQMTVIFVPKRRSDVEKQIQLMSNGQSSSVYEEQIDCQADDEQVVPCQVTILALFNQANEVNSWVIMIKDNSLIQKQRLESEKAKRKSETLLYNILPRTIVTRINAGERDVTFSIPEVTIMFCSMLFVGIDLFLDIACLHQSMA